MLVFYFLLKVYNIFGNDRKYITKIKINTRIYIYKICGLSTFDSHLYFNFLLYVIMCFPSLSGNQALYA